MTTQGARDAASGRGDEPGDRFDLQRFVDAQARVYGDVLDELRAGRKQSHWMRFVFPQVAGLGRSATARHFAIRDLDEAVAYARHPLLGARLVECTGLVNAIRHRSAQAVFGSPDDMKFRSSMTLFERATGDAVFTDALLRWFDGERDARTLAALAAPSRDRPA